jgi:O-methyltransferase
MNGIAKALFVNAVGRLPDFSPVINQFSSWIQFSHWCISRGRYDFRKHPHAERAPYFDRILRVEQLAAAEFDFLEFGVYQGESLRWWRDHAEHRACRFVGFDTFSGLPQGWRDRPVGYFTTHGQIPEMNDTRFSFCVGLFQDTLPTFLKTFRRERRLVLHLDADLYSSTLFVLMAFAAILRNGDLLLFDEFSCASHEFRAFQDFISVFDRPYIMVDSSANFTQVCLRVK